MKGYSMMRIGRVRDDHNNLSNGEQPSVTASNSAGLSGNSSRVHPLING
jgi:hypothetical protein